METTKPASSFQIKNFISQETLSGFLLIVAAIIAMIWVNSRWSESYDYIWHQLKLKVLLGDRGLSYSLQHWVNDGLMAIFFFTIGLEIKREIMAGELSTLKKASLPVLAAIGGMLIPASLFLLVNANNPEYVNGWGIPMATDIAFSLGILSLLGSRVNISVKIFLTALAIADDLGAILVISIFYTESINFNELIYAGTFLAVLIIANKIGVRRATFYGLVGLFGVWLSFIYSGVHATVAGVLIALTIPARPKVSEMTYIQKLEKLLNRFRGENPNDSSLLTKEQVYIISKIEKVSEDANTPLQKLEHALHPAVAFIVLPLFALGNAGVHIEGNLLDMIFHPLSLGIIIGLVLGKFLGITLLSKLGVWLKIAELPEGVKWREIYAVAFLAGIGFTMSMFISDLALSDPEDIGIAKIGIFTASLISATLGMILFSFGPKSKRE